MEHLLRDITGLDSVLAVALLVVYLWRRAATPDPDARESA